MEQNLGQWVNILLNGWLFVNEKFQEEYLGE